MNRYHTLIFLLFTLLSSPSWANDALYVQTVKKPFQETYTRVYEALEANKFFVIFEPQIGKNMARFQKRWGEDYNRNQLENIRSLVFCNVWYTNQLSNLDPHQLSVCPLSIALYHKKGESTVVFRKPTVTAAKSPALPLLKELETDIINAIKTALTDNQ